MTESLEPLEPLEPPAAPPTAPAADPRVLLHMPVDVRSASLVLIAVLISVHALQWASAVFIPLAMGLVFSYALAPVVDLLERWRLPRAIGAAIVVLSILGAAGWAGYTLRDDANSLIDALPDAARNLRESIGARGGPRGSNLDNVQKAARQLEQAATHGSTSAASVPRGVTRVQIEKAAFDIQDYLVVGTLHLVEVIGQAVVVLSLTYFLLVSGDVFRRKLAHIAGPTFARRKITVQALNEISEQIERYLLVQLFISVFIGLATGVAFWAIGLDHFAVWGVVAGLLNLVPYLGPVAICALSSVVALTQFGSLDAALLVAGTTVALHLVTHLVTPWLTSRTSRLNAVAVFVGVLAFGWLWGVAGLLLGTPILIAVKAVCDRVDDLKPVGELLGGPGLMQ